jgi:hypothetical protein
MTETIEKLFRTPQEALIFAFNYSMQQQDRPLMDRLASPAARTGKGLSGNDGAAQAGMIRREMEELSELQRAALIARYAPRSMPCSCRRPCCSGYQINQEWDAAIRVLEQGALTMLAGRVSQYRMRRKLVEQIFGVKVVLKDLAEQCGVHQNTATEHRKIIRLWICGQKAQHAKGGREAVSAVDGIESSARKKIDNLLSCLDFVGA